MNRTGQGSASPIQCLRTMKVPAGSRQSPGIVEWLRPGDYQRADDVMADLSALSLRHFRTGFAWTDWQAPGGKNWFDWLIPTIAGKFQLLPCFTCSPPATTSKHSAPTLPCDSDTFAEFIARMIQNYGSFFEWIELGNALDDSEVWDWSLDSSWDTFSQLMTDAIRTARDLHKKPVLSGVSPADLGFLDRLCDTGALEHVEALGLSGFPGTWNFDWQQWPRAVKDLRKLLAGHGLSPELWVTATGYSTWRHDHVLQARKLIDALAAPVKRVYWYSLFDLPREETKPEDFGLKNLGQDERCYHFGLKTAEGQAKFTYRIWRERGLEGLGSLVNDLLGRAVHPGQALTNSFRSQPSSSRETIGLSVLPRRAPKRPVLITGGAGFIGTNLARRLARERKSIVILDNLNRPGVERNLESLLESHGNQVEVSVSDIRDLPTVTRLVQSAEQVYHFAAQVAVTTSLEAPREDFDVNLNGTLNILESLREMDHPPPLLFTSTNKVYGALDDVALQRIDGRYQPVSEYFAQGISEQQSLDFHSPYGCSKGAADQYVLDYARSYGVPAIAFRMSCVYGPHQFGTEDQGWVAHFLIQALQGKPLTLYGDGHQVRDLLFVEDLVDAMITAQQHMPALAGRAFNMGGGVENSTSLLEIVARIERLTGRPCKYSLADWRLGDQHYYVSDTRLFQQLTGWRASTDIDSGLHRLHAWLTKDSSVLPDNNPLSMPTGEGALQGGKRI